LLGASTSWNPQGLSRPVMELIYLKIREFETTCYRAWSERSVTFRRTSLPQVRSAISLVCREADSDPLVITQRSVFLTSSRHATRHLCLIRTSLEYSHNRHKITKCFYWNGAFCTGLRYSWFFLVMQTHMLTVIRVLTSRQLIFARRLSLVFILNHLPNKIRKFYWPEMYDRNIEFTDKVSALNFWKKKSFLGLMKHVVWRQKFISCWSKRIG